MLEGKLQGAEAHWLDVLDVNLIFAARLIDADGAAHGDVEAVLGAKLQALQLGAETDAANLRARILEREVQMAGLRGVGVGDFALDGDVGKFAGEQVADAAGKVADRPDAALGHEGHLKRRHFEKSKD